MIRPGVLALLALAVGALLALLFPGLDFGHPKHLGPPDELSIAYLQQVLRTHPEDRPARLLLARQQMALGHWDEAEASLRRLVDASDRFGVQARMDLLELARARVDALPPTDPARPARQRESLSALRRLIPVPLRAEELERLAEAALALGAPGDAADLYLRLAAFDAPNRHDWLLRAARWKRAAGALGASAEGYLAASAAAPVEWAARDDVLSALEVLTAADRGADALRSAETALGRWPTDRRLLDRAVALARAQDDGARAKRWSERLIQLNPDDGEALRRHLEIELGARDIGAAFVTATHLVELHPEDVALRRRLAETATWAGHPEEALAAWAWLASHGSDDAGQRALALGRDLYDYGRVAEVLHRKARSGKITLDELLDLSDALESLGTPDRARVVLRQLERTFAGSRAYWSERAEVDEHVSDLAGALASIQEAQRRFGPRAQDAEREVELLWALGRSEEALAAARQAAPSMTDDVVSFWRTYADLAWSLEADRDAEMSYLRLWALDKRNANVAERLVTLLAGKKRDDEVIRIGSEGFKRFASPSLLVAALDTAAEAERWDDVRSLMGLVRTGKSEALFVDQPAYWSAEGRLLAHDGDARGAAAAFAKAVALQPADTSAREDLLWARVDAGLERGPGDDGGGDDNDAATRLATAIARHDRAAVRAIATRESGALTPSEQADAARELGDDERAWTLVTRAPSRSGDTDEDAAVAEHRRELAEERLSGVWASGGLQALGPLGLFQQGVRGALRRGPLGVELLAQHDRLDASPGTMTTLVSGVHSDELHAGAALSLREAWGDTRLEAGGYSLSSGAVAYLIAQQRFSPSEQVDLELEGLYHQLPTDTAALRVAGLRDAVEGAATWRVGAGFALGGAVGATRYTARDGDLLAGGWFGRGEVSRTMHLAGAIVRPRADAFLEENSLVSTLPPSLVALVRSGVQAGNLLPASYATTGVGLTLLRRRDDDDDEIGTGRGCAPCLRPFLDAWTGWLIPAQRLTYSLDTGLGFLFLRHQEVSASGFLYSDYRGETGQRYSGASLSYTLRWL